jgi:hypothetical protein
LWARLQFSTGAEVRQIRLIEVRADGGASEIDHVIAKLPGYQTVERDLKRKR